MRKGQCVIALISIGYFGLMLYAHIRPQWLCVILAVLALGALALGFLISIVLGLKTWRRRSRLWRIPALTCIVAFLAGTCLTAPIGRFIADRHFLGHASEYMKVVDDVTNGMISCEIRCAGKFGSLALANRPTHVKALSAAICEDGKVAVAFLLDTNIPRLHHGYVYSGYKESDGCAADAMKLSNNWPHIRHVAGSWYHFSDQPGM